ncbi:MAG TPA: DUF4861 family protein, partial [Bacteroidota bacterium]|nr:DUF4861 family protein [Bacteroidota bacterium]
GTTTSRNEKSCWISLWGLTTDKEETGYLGTAIVMSKKILKEMKEDSIHALMTGRAEFGSSLTYFAGAGSTRSGDFSSAEDWNNYLSDFAQRMEAPLVVSISVK